MACTTTYSYTEQHEINYTVHDGTAISVGTLQGSGWFEFAVPRTAVSVVVGLSAGAAEDQTNFTDLTHALHFLDGQTRVREGTVYRGSWSALSGMDTWYIVRMGKVVYYLRGSGSASIAIGGVEFPATLVHTSRAPSTGPVRLKAYLLHGMDTVQNAAMDDLTGINDWQPLVTPIRWWAFAVEQAGAWTLFNPVSLGRLSAYWDDEINWKLRLASFVAFASESASWATSYVVLGSYDAGGNDSYSFVSSPPIVIGKLFAGLHKEEWLLSYLRFNALAYGDGADICRVFLGYIGAYASGSVAFDCGAQIVLPELGFIYGDGAAETPVAEIEASGIMPASYSQNPAFITETDVAAVKVELVAPRALSIMLAPVARINATPRAPTQGATVACGVSETIVSPALPTHGIAVAAPVAAVQTQGQIPDAGVSPDTPSAMSQVTALLPATAVSPPALVASVSVTAQAPSAGASPSMGVAQVELEVFAPTAVAATRAPKARVEVRAVAPYGAVDVVDSSVITRNTVNGGVTEYSVEWIDVVVIDDEVYGLAPAGIYKLSNQGDPLTVQSSVKTGEISFDTSMGKRCSGIELDTDSSTTLAATLIDADGTEYATQLKAGAPTKRKREYNAPRGVMSTRFAYKIAGTSLVLNGIRASVTEGSRK